MAQEAGAAAVLLRGHLGEPDGGLHRLDLAEERPDALKPVAAPVLQEPGRLRCDLPLALRQAPPGGDAVADLVDDGCGVVPLLEGRQRVARIERHLALLGRALALLLRHRDRCDQIGTPPPPDDPVGGPTFVVELPVPTGKVVGRIEDRGVEETCGAHRRVSRDR